MRTDPAVQEFFDDFDHPMKVDIQAIRELILGSDSTICEGIKWNSMSFRTSEWFATLNKRATNRIEIVLHLGAKAKLGTEVSTIDDPTGLLKWLAKDRALLIVQDANWLRTNQDTIQNLIRNWILFV